MTNHVMIDLETLGTGGNAVIKSIGAVQFSASGIGRKFSTNVDVQSCLDMGLSVDGSTIEWWMRAEPGAREMFAEPASVISESLMNLSAWMPDDVNVWGNGSDFDNPILANAYRACGLEQPWKFYHSRCYRTIKSLCPDVSFERVGVHHRAVDDAGSQALHLVECLRMLRRVDLLCGATK